MNSERMKAFFQSDISSTEQAIAKFTGTLAVNPAYAMEWADSLYEHAARNEAASRLAELITLGEEQGVSEEEIVAEVQRHIQAEMRRQIMQATSHSTSQSTNMLNGARLKVYARLADTFCE